ncbi:MAG: pyruvate kinase, partial [Anaerolineaceae bacterium]|nr:pyruvate kinase [Anaerolineaceae bacterium]
IKSGMDVARLNFSHGTHEDHAARIQLIRKISKELNKPVAILQDLQGPKMRVGDLPKDGIELVVGKKVIFTAPETDISNSTGDPLIIPLDVPQLSSSVHKGNRILLDDGRLEVEVIGVVGADVEAKVILGGTLTSHKGVNLPGADLKIPCFTEKDEADLIFGLAHDIDAVAISFVHTAEDIEFVRKEIERLCPDKCDLPIIAKLERPEAIQHLHKIMHAADGVMVARGDLAVETSPAAVPIIQKEIIAMANRHAKIVITATQMLDSMMVNPRPTRAEASDVANAILDGTDAVMLSGETASGKYPIESVLMMNSIVIEAEKNIQEWGHCQDFPSDIQEDDAISITRAAKELAHDRNVAYIAVFTQTGRTALLMSKARPRVPIVALTPVEKVFSRMSLQWGVIPYLVPFASTVESMLHHVEEAMVSTGLIKPGQQVVVISGYPVGDFRLPNFALLHTVGENLRNGN